MANQIKKKWIGLNQIDGERILLDNDETLRARRKPNPDGSLGSPLDLMKLDDHDKLQFLEMPMVSNDPSDGNHLSRKSYVDQEIDSAKSELQDQIDAHESRIDTAESDISNLQAADVTLQGNIDAEASARAAADVVLQGNINAEAAARENADSLLDGRLDIIEGADNVVGSVAKSLKDSKDYTDSKITDLVNGAPAVLDTLKELADALGSDANFSTTIAGQISSLDGRLDTLEGGKTVSGSVAYAVDAEAVLRAAADVVLQGNIDAEAAARAAGDAAEAAARTAAINTLQTNYDNLDGYAQDIRDDLDAEVVARAAADTAEASARAAADSTEQAARIAGDAAEASARAAADVVLQGNIDAEAAARTAAVSAEASARESADNLLDGRLDILEGADNVVGSVAKSLKDSKDYTDSKITDLVNGAPAILDTLKELADALGNDASFATTIAGQISSLDGRLDTLEGDATVSGSVAYAVAAEASARSSADSVLSGRIDALEDSVDALPIERMNYESKVVSMTDIANGYIEVQYDIVSQPMVQVNRVWLAPYDDFSVSGKQINFSSLQATSEALEETDKLHIWYVRAN